MAEPTLGERDDEAAFLFDMKRLIDRPADGETLVMTVANLRAVWLAGLKRGEEKRGMDSRSDVEEAGG